MCLNMYLLSTHFTNSRGKVDFGHFPLKCMLPISYGKLKTCCALRKIVLSEINFKFASALSI